MDNIETNFFSFYTNIEEETEINIEETELNIEESELNIEESELNIEETELNIETELNTEVELVAKKMNNMQISKNKTEKLKIKLLSNSTPNIFTKVKDLYDYIKINTIKEYDYYIFKIKKNNYNIIIKMRTPKHILNYILTYQVEYDVLQ